MENGYAAQSVGTLAVKAELGKKQIERGDTQSMEFQVQDAKTHQPVSVAIAKVTITYAGGTTIKHIDGITDASGQSSGQSSVFWTIEDNAVTGVYNIDALVTATGYQDASFSTISFTVLPYNIGNNNHHHNHHNHN